MHIAIATHSLCLVRGGCEYVAVELAKNMHQRGHDVTLYSWGDMRGNACNPAYPLPHGVMHRACNGNDGAANELAKLRHFLIESNTDVLVSLQDCHAHLFWASTCLGTGIPFIYSEHTAPARVEAMTWNQSGRLAAMSGADAIHLLLPAYVESVPAPWKDKVRVIPNAMPVHTKPAHIGDAGEKILLYLGRLEDVKRPELLVQSFALLRERHPDWRLDIWGIGSIESRLHRLLHELHLGKFVRLCGLALEPSIAYATAQCYCLPSRLEGFPMTVLEAMAAGLPVVGVADCEAMRGIVTPGVNGLLAPEATPQSLAQTLDTLMADAALRRKLSAGALQTESRYAPENIYDQWEALLAGVAARKGHTVLDGFAAEPFATRAELSRLARREWLFRDFGRPWPGTMRWYVEAARTTATTLWKNLRRRFGQ